MKTFAFKTASRQNPCPTCRKHSWCSITADGITVICRRNAAEAIHERTDKNGVPYWLHSNPNGRSLESPIQRRIHIPPPFLSTEKLHSAYGYLLELLPLHQNHRENLRHRGLSDAQITMRGYGSLPLRGRADVANRLANEYGPELCRSLPGLYQKVGDKGGLYWTMAGRPGLLIPVRNLQGQIISLKIRHDVVDIERARYTTLSSISHGGCGPGQQVHVSLRKDEDHSIIRITEGELKADIATALSGVWTLSIPGVMAWSTILTFVDVLNPKKILLSLDTDASKNIAVARAQAYLAYNIQSKNINVEVEVW